jgi:signal transduction histidine kinase
MAVPRSANIKLSLLVAAIIIVVIVLLYTQFIVSELLVKEKKVADLYAKSLEFIVAMPTDQSDYSFIFNEVIQSIDFPMILTDENNEPLREYWLNSRNVRLDSTLPILGQRELLVKAVKTLDAKNPPIRVVMKTETSDSLIQLLHYGESALITKLRWLPLIEIAVAAMFILIGYISFSYIKRTEQSNIWVGMAKETAHQLGTPLSSLMGWLEMMKEYAAENPKQLATISEMACDLQRLEKVTERFSKIGSKPSVKDENLHEVINSVILYLRQRLPSRYGEGRHIDIGIATEEQVHALINSELFEWVIENLIKNAVDAIEGNEGAITFSLSRKGSNVIIDVKDTGKGIDMKYKKDIFRPGFSTKKRGWGLGLSLSKRIIESYHHGKLYIKESKPGKGTTFRIKLNALN